LGLKTTGRRFLGFGPQNTVGVQTGMGGDTWHHREAYVEAKQSHEERVAVKCIDQELNHFASMDKWFNLNI